MAPYDLRTLYRHCAHKAEEVDKSIQTTDPAVRNAAERTVRFGFAGLRVMPVIPPDLFWVARKNPGGPGEDAPEGEAPP
jgi:hypothetical protein